MTRNLLSPNTASPSTLDVLRTPGGGVVIYARYRTYFQSNLQSKRSPKIAKARLSVIWFLHDAFRVAKPSGMVHLLLSPGHGGRIQDGQWRLQLRHESPLVGAREPRHG
jgi:hypothetical protein